MTWKESPKEEQQAEYERCKNDPYYFATTYWKVEDKPFTTRLTREEFNKYFNRLNQKANV